MKRWQEINELILKTHNEGDYFSIKKGSIINHDNDIEHNKNIYLITNGRINISRKHDGLVLWSATAPSIIGLASMFTQSNNHLATAVSECSGYRFSESLFYGLVEKYNLWQEISIVLSCIVSILSKRDEELIGLNSYRIVRNKLIELISLPEEERINFNACKYIQERTFLSRSGILKILSELRSGNYIIINDGRLHSINHLPEKY